MKRRPVKSISPDGCIQVFASVTEAARAVGGIVTNIIAAIRHPESNKTCRGYRWEYADDGHITPPRAERMEGDNITDCMPWPKWAQLAYPERYAKISRGKDW